MILFDLRQNLQMCVGPLFHILLTNIEDKIQGTTSKPDRCLLFEQHVYCFIIQNLTSLKVHLSFKTTVHLLFPDSKNLLLNLRSAAPQWSDSGIKCVKVQLKTKFLELLFVCLLI